MKYIILKLKIKLKKSRVSIEKANEHDYIIQKRIMYASLISLYLISILFLLSIIGAAMDQKPIDATWYFIIIYIVNIWISMILYNFRGSSERIILGSCLTVIIGLPITIIEFYKWKRRNKNIPKYLNN